jgi:hypothetical protein
MYMYGFVPVIAFVPRGGRAEVLSIRDARCTPINSARQLLQDAVDSGRAQVISSRTPFVLIA